MKVCTEGSLLRSDGTLTQQSVESRANGPHGPSAPNSRYNETSSAYLDLPATDEQLPSFRYVRRWFGSLPVLDLGCAMGAYLRQFGPGSIGADVSRPNLDHCSRLGLHVVSADLNRELPFASASFPAVLCSHVLEHVDAPINLLRECHRILQPEGLLVLGLPIETSLVNWLRGHRYFYHHPGHLYSFSLENIDVLLQKTGYKMLGNYFEPRIVRARSWYSLMQRLPSRAMYLLALAYWVVARRV